MAIKNLKAALIPAFIILFFVGCSKKFEKQGALPQAGIMLSFDDNCIDNWYRNLPLLDSFHAKATFYVSKYNRLTAEQKQRLVIIQSHGHEIAYHTVNHYNMMDYVYKQKHTPEELMRNEIEAGLKAMNKDGIYPITFAYPYGAHNAIFDKMLKRYFKSVRALNGTQDFSKSIAPTEKNDVLYGLGIDKSSKRKDSDVISFLNSAKNNNACAVFVAHEINSSNNLSVTAKRLKDIFTFVKNNGLKFYTASEISN